MDQEITKEFLIESYEILNALDNDLVALERQQADAELLNRIFRGVHTIKGTSGFLSFTKLVAITHIGEGLLDRLRKGSLALSEDITSALLALVDAVREILTAIEATGEEGEADYAALKATLERLQNEETPREETRSEAPQQAAPQQAAPQQKAEPREEAAFQETATPQEKPPANAPDTEAADASPPARQRRPVGRSSALADNTIRVDVEMLDGLMNLVGELVLTRNRMLQHAGAQDDAAFTASSQHLDLITTELQEGVMKTRMQPIQSVWRTFPRVVRDVAVSCGKEARVEMEGAETELDKTILEAIKDPLTHLVRNAVDHGLEAPDERTAAGKPEEGRLLLRAFHEGGQVNIEIADDGAGIHPARIKAKALERGLRTQDELDSMSDHEALRLIFLPGFSTAQQVSNISGRGVGMDVVRTNIEKIGGTVGVHSTVGEGTTLKIKIPLTLAIIPALTIRAQGERFAIPQVNVLELVRLEGAEVPDRIERLYNTSLYRLRGKLLPLVYLSRELELVAASEGAVSQDQGTLYVVVLQAGDQHFGLVVDEVIDTEEVVVKPLSKQLKSLAAYAGAMIMGDGKVALILDVPGLARRAGVLSSEAARRAQAEAQAEAAARQEARREDMLLLRAGGRRLALPLARVSRLEEIAPARIEQVGPRELVQYRGRLLRLLRLGRVLGGGAVGGDGAPRPARQGEALQVVVCALDGTDVGLVVSEITDVAEACVEPERFDAASGIAGVTVVEGRATELLDVDALAARAGVVRAPAPSAPALVA